jgi:hypothetical protein
MTPPFSRSLHALSCRSIRMVLGLLALSPLVSAGHLIVVDAGGTADFNNIQDAVTVSQPGDMILILAGAYDGFSIANKSVHVAAVDGALVTVQGRIEVRNTQPDSVVTLRGLTSTGGYFGNTTGEGLWAHNCQGSVRVDDCFLKDLTNSTAAVRLEQCASVTITGSTLSAAGVDAFVATDSNVALFRTIAEGHMYGYSSGAAVRLVGTAGKFFATGCTFQGGHGQAGECSEWNGEVSPGDGGDGLVNEGWSPFLQDTLVAGGSGGTAAYGFPWCNSNDGVDGVDIIGPVTILPGVGRSLLVSSVAEEVTGSVTIDFQGEPGDRAFLLASFRGRYELGSTYDGPRLLAQPGLGTIGRTNGGSSQLGGGIPLALPSLYVGMIDASGILSLQVPILPGTASSPLRTVQLQAVMQDSSGSIWMTDAKTLSVIPCSEGLDCNANGIGDACDLASGFSTDCNADGVPDECEVDCNGNGLGDTCDIQSGFSTDCDGNGIPDECDYDCNGNGLGDACDIMSGISTDCDGNGIPDECESDVDCNGNGIGDTCELLFGQATDCNGNGIPDDCDWDCNQNGVPDSCDIAQGTSLDIDSDGSPDECDHDTLIYVDIDAPPGGNGSSWGTAYNNLQVALAFRLDHHAEIDEIWVAEGVYTPVWSGSGYHPTAQYFKITEGVRMRGGFVGTESFLSERDLSLHETVLSGDLHSDDVFPNGMEDNSWNIMVLQGADNALVDGFTIRGGNTSQLGNVSGAGMLIWPSQNFVISRCKIVNNRAAYWGGGVHLTSWPSGPILSGDFLNCVIADNLAMGGTASLGQKGGGIGISGHIASNSVVRFVNCEITGNHAADSGGGIHVEDGSCQLQILASTIHGNTSTGGVGGIESGSTTLSVHGSILWGNTSASGVPAHSGQLGGLLASQDVRLSCVEGATVFPGAGNINLPPMFVNEGTGDLALSAGSPCIDAGRNGAIPVTDPSDLDQDGITGEELPHDLRGRTRRLDDPATSDTGSGATPVVDIGAHEF